MEFSVNGLSDGGVKVDWIFLQVLRRVNDYLWFCKVVSSSNVSLGISVLGSNDSCIQSYVLHVDGGGGNFSHETG